MRPEVSIGKIIPENERGPAAAREADAPVAVTRHLK